MNNESRKGQSLTERLNLRGKFGRGVNSRLPCLGGSPDDQPQTSRAAVFAGRQHCNQSTAAGTLSNEGRSTNNRSSLNTLDGGGKDAASKRGSWVNGQTGSAIRPSVVGESNENSSFLQNFTRSFAKVIINSDSTSNGSNQTTRRSFVSTLPAPQAVQTQHDPEKAFGNAAHQKNSPCENTRNNANTVSTGNNFQQDSLFAGKMPTGISNSATRVSPERNTCIVKRHDVVRDSHPRGRRQRSRAIAIKRNRVATTDEFDGTPASCERMYDWATWRMYNRIIDYRRRRPITHSNYEPQTSQNIINLEDMDPRMQYIHSLHSSLHQSDYFDGEVFELEI